MKRLRACLVLGCLLAMGGCERSLASASTPDFSGTWDVTYDDSFEVELQQGTQTLRGAVSELGGEVSFGGDAGAGVALHVNCADDQVLCPSEVWPRELRLRAAPGALDDNGTQLVRALTGSEGARKSASRCAVKPGSVLTGEVLTSASAHSIRPEALALTSGRIHVRFDASCFAAGSTLAPGAEVILSTGYTAAKR